jgi:hypothetical protein
MTIQVLTIHPDGTQTVEFREVLEDFFSPDAAQSAQETVK